MNTFVALATLVVNLAGAVFVGVSVILLKKQIKDSHEWDRLKTSQEILATLTTGEFPSLREKLEVDSGCEIWNEAQNYNDKSDSHSSPLEVMRLRFTLTRILNVLEAISIDIQKGIVCGEICYKFLGGIFIHYARWSEPLIANLETKYDMRVYENLTDLAAKWRAHPPGEAVDRQ